MTARHARKPGTAPGVVRVRLSGEPADIDRVAGLLAGQGTEVLDTTGPRPNRIDPGVRMYLTVRLPDGGAR